MRLKFVLSALAISLLAVIVPTVLAGTCTSQIPMGGIAPQRPIWCETLAVGTDTHIEAENAWLDDFNHGNSFADLNPAYLEGFFGNGDSLHFQHNNHWMVDVQSDGNGALIGAWMRPNRTFKLQPNGTLVVEFEVAGPIAGTRSVNDLSDSWPEMVITTAPAPPGMQSWGSFIRRNGTYLYEAFPGHETFGCRMQQSKHPICAYYIADFGTAGTRPSRTWEINQNGGEVTFERGGGPGGLAPAAWKGCDSVQDPDTMCRNKFRWELRSNHVKLFVNGVEFYEAGLIDNSLSKIFNHPGGFYVFNGDFAYRMNPGKVLRFHWDHLAVNPELLGSGPAPTPTPVPPTPTPAATPVPTIVAAGPATITFNNLANPNRVLTGQTAPITWGPNWYLSGPYGSLTTNSISFTGGPKTGSFTFSSPRQLAEFDVYNGSSNPSTVTIMCGGSTTRTIPAKTLVHVVTGLAGTCTTVTLTSSNGWDTNFDNLRIV